jgi:hypothetical protein
MAEERRIIRAPERMAPPPEIVSLEDINIRLKRLNDNILKLVTLFNENVRMLKASDERLARLEAAVREQVPEGILVPMIVTFSGTKIIDLRTEPWYSFSLFNDKDSGDIYVGVNTSPEQEVPIHEMESYDCPFGKRGSIKTIHLVCEKGKSATVRIYGVR